MGLYLTPPYKTMLTPLQEATLAIYCARFNGLSSQSEISQIHTDKMLEQSISQAKALLEACKPEPLEWVQDKLDGPVWRSKCGQFKIVSHFANDYNLWNAMTNTELYPSYETLELAKQFAEHIRTR